MEKATDGMRRENIQEAVVVFFTESKYNFMCFRLDRLGGGGVHVCGCICKYTYKHTYTVSTLLWQQRPLNIQDF